MRHPLAAIPRGRRARVFVPLLAATLAVMLGVFAPIDLVLRTPASPQGVVSFELAGDLRQAQGMIAAWNERARLFAAFGLGLDYLFLLLYSTTIALACLWAGEVVGAVALGAVLAWGQWIAAALDAVENFALARLLLGGQGEPWPAVAWWCAVPKFGIVAAGMLFALVGGVARLAGRRT